VIFLEYGLMSLFLGSFVGKAIYVLSGMLPKWERDAIADDCLDYIGINVERDSTDTCAFRAMSKEPSYWVPLVAFWFNRPFPKSTGIAKYEVLTIEMLAIITCYLVLFLNGSDLSTFYIGGFLILTVLCILVDFHSRFLPDAAVYPLLWLGLIYSTTDSSGITPVESIKGVVVCYVFMYVLNKAAYLKSGLEAYAWGDIRLLASVSAWLGEGSVMPLIICCLISSTILKRGSAFGPIIIFWTYVLILQDKAPLTELLT